MPRPPGVRTGQDYSRTRQTLNTSDLQKRDNNTYQAINDLVSGAEKFQGFIDNEFPQLDGSTSSLYNAVKGIIEELQDRQNSKYNLSITNSTPISVPPFEETQMTFDIDELNDGLMHWQPGEVRINHHAAWQIYGRVVACIPTDAELKIIVKINGEPQIPACITGSGKIIFPFIGLKELLRNDIVTLWIFHTATLELDVLPTLQMHRVSWVANENASGRRISSEADDSVCVDDFKNNLDDCICVLPGVAFAVLPQSKNTYFLNKDAKITNQIAAPTDKSSTFCGNRKGNFYIAVDDVASGFTKLLEYKTTGELASTNFLTLRIGQGPTSAAHCLMELPCNFILSVNRVTHKVTEYDLTINAVSRILGLTINPFDGCVNSAGNRLLYVNGTKLSAWDLKGDIALSDIIDFGFTFSWPTWLSDCSVIIFTGSYLGNGNFRRVMLNGTLLDTYTYDTSVFPNGLIGYAASVTFDRLWIVGLDSINRVTTTILKLSDGSIIKENENWKFAPTVINETAMVGAIYTPIKCSIAT